MQDKNKRNLCVLLSTALLAATLPAAIGAAAENVQPAPRVEDTQNPETTAAPTTAPEATADPSATATPEPTAAASATPEPTAAPPAEVTMDMEFTANVYTSKDDKSAYEIRFTTANTLPEITAFEMTVSFTDASVMTATFTDDLKENGKTNVTRGDREATFTYSEAKEPISGRTLLGAVNISLDEDAKLNIKNIKVDRFTATTKDGGKLIINPSVAAYMGDSIPELEKNEQAVVDLIKALPQKTTISFFEDKEKGTFINTKDLTDQTKQAQQKYNALNTASKRKVDSVLASESLSADGLDDLVKLAENISNNIGAVEIGYSLKDVTEKDVLDYAFFLEAFKELKFSASDLLGATTALEEFNSALTAVNQAQTYYDGAVKDADYDELVDALSNQYENLRKASIHSNYKKYVTILTENANDLKKDIKENYSGSDKNALIRQIESVIDSINQDQEVSKDLPSFKVGTVYYNTAYSVTLTRKNEYPDYEDGKIEVTVRNASNSVMDTGSGTFRKSSRTASVSMKANSNSYKLNQRITIYVTYELNGTTYDLGSHSTTVLTRTSGSNNNTNNNSGISRPGNTVFPTATPQPTQRPETDDELFHDIASYDWAEEAIEGLYYAGIIDGMEPGVFNPAGLVTREQFSKMVVQLFGVSGGAGNTNFLDVKADAWYAPYIASAVASGYVQGQSDEYFGIGEQIMRQDMATILYRALGRDQDKKPITFTDADQIAPYAYDAVSELVGLGALNGYEDGTFKPRGTATRAEAAKVIWSVYNTLNK